MNRRDERRYAARAVLALCSTICFSTAGAEGTRIQRSTYVKAMFSAPLTSDPALMNDGPSLVLSNLIYDGLLAFSPDLELRPALAKAWRIERGGRRLVFDLREDAKFHDGTAVTPEAVVSSLHRLVAPNSRVSSYYTCISGAAAYLHGKAKRVAGLRTVGATRVEIDLDYPFPPFLTVLAGATAKVLPIAAATDPEFFVRPIGSGPFVYGAKDGSKELVLTAFDGYYAGRPKIDRLVLKQMNGDEALRAAERREVGDLANYYLNGDEKAFTLGQHLFAPVAATWIIGLNTRLPPFDRPEVRKAFKAAVSTEEFRKRFYSTAIPAKGYIPPGMLGFQWEYQKPAAKARRKVIVPEAITLQIPSDIPKSKEISAYLQDSLRASGFAVQTNLSSWPDLMKGYTEKTLQSFLVSMNIDYPDTEFLVRNFESSNPDNFSGLQDSAIDALIRKARATPDKANRQKIYAVLAERLNDAAVTVDLLYPQGHYWVHPCVRGFEPNLLADAYVDYRRISMDMGCLATIGSSPETLAQ